MMSRVLKACLIIACLAATALAQEVEVQLDPAKTKVDFVLSGSMHTVHGDFQLKSGTLRFDRQNGTAAGELRVEAASGESGNTKRDHKMQEQVLESAKFPEIVFEPQRVSGQLSLNGTSQMQVAGLMTIHGQTHDITAAGPVQISGDTVSADLRFMVPYQQWGMKNPSVIFLRVSDKVEITVHAVGKLTSAVASGR